jgi:hypothetical protein
MVCDAVAVEFGLAQNVPLVAAVLNQ